MFVAITSILSGVFIAIVRSKMSLKIDFKSFIKPRRKLKNGFPIGMVLFTGKQGGGKSLSQSRYMRNLQLKWNARVYSATDYVYADDIIQETEIAEKILTKRQSRPTIFALDEIQVLLERDNTDSFTRSQMRKAIQQQRKRNTSIVGTCQELLDLDTIYRRQLAYVVRCFHFGPIQIEFWLDGATLKFDDNMNKYTGSLVDVCIWKRHNDIYDLYDTFQVVGEKQGVTPSNKVRKEKIHVS